MNAQSFCYWCHGWSEINGGGAPNALQWQIIVDHLNLVLNEREAAAAPKAAPRAATTRVELPPGVPLTSNEVRILSGWADIEADRNRGSIYITVAPEPNYDSKASYSFYQYNTVDWQKPELADPMQRALLTGLGVYPTSDKVYLVVDNALKPTKSTYADNMRGGGNHLTMMPKSGPGIINVGTGPAVYC